MIDSLYRVSKLSNESNPVMLVISEVLLPKNVNHVNRVDEKSLVSFTRHILRRNRIKCRKRVNLTFIVIFALCRLLRTLAQRKLGVKHQTFQLLGLQIHFEIPML